MLIFDAHLDMAWNALEWNRNLEWPVHKIREFEKQFTGVNPGIPQYRDMARAARGARRYHDFDVAPATASQRQGTLAFTSRLASCAYASAYGQLLLLQGARRQGSFARDSRCENPHGPRSRMGARRDRQTADRLHPQHGGQPADFVAVANCRMVRGWFENPRAVALRSQVPLQSRDGERREPACRGTGALARDGQRRNDSGRHAPGGSIVLGSARHLPGPRAGEPSQLPRAGLGRPPVGRRPDQGAHQAGRR